MPLAVSLFIKKVSGNSSSEKVNQDVEIMASITYLMEKGNMGYMEVVKLPYPIYLGLMRQFQLSQLRQNEDYVEMEKMCSTLHQTKPDMERLQPYLTRKKVGE